MAATVADLGARALRRLGIVAVAASDRPALSVTVPVATIAQRALDGLGVVVPAAERPGAAATVSIYTLAARALEMLGVVIPFSERPVPSVTINAADVALRALQWLGVVASDETPLAADLSVATVKAQAVHEALNAAAAVTWAVSAIPHSVSEEYTMLTAMQLATEFGKTADGAQRPVLEARVKRASLVARSQALAEARVSVVHDHLLGQAAVTWTTSAIPAAVSEEYATLVAMLLAPEFGAEMDMARKPVLEAEVRQFSLLARAQALAEARVLSVHDALVSQGAGSWASGAIPQAVAEEYAMMARLYLAPEFGQKADMGLLAAAEGRVKRFALVARGQLLAEQKVINVHTGLAARGKARWTLLDIPTYIEEIYVVLAANMLAPEFETAANQADAMWAARELAQVISLPSAGGPVRAEYF